MPEPSPRVFSGRRLNRILKYAKAKDRALLALGLAQSRAQLRDPTYAQAARPGSSFSYVAKLGRLSEDKRARLARGEVSFARIIFRSTLDSIASSPSMAPSRSCSIA
jgi:hypothetical protein